MRSSDESVMEDKHLTPEERIALQAEEIKQLWQENEQLRAQVARMRDAMKGVSGNGMAQNQSNQDRPAETP